MFEQGDELNLEAPTPQPEPGAESSNKTFLIVAGVMAGLVFLSLICMAVYALVISPNQKAKTSATQMAIETQNALMAQQMTQTAVALLLPSPVLASPIPEASQTPVVAVATNTLAPEIDPLTATMAALNTQVAIAQKTPTSTLVGTFIAMPQSGFADQVGLPGLVILAAAFVVIILLARRLRSSPARH